MSGEIDLQREIAKIALDLLGREGFVLAGSGAIREHGIISRLSQDIDLFTTMSHLKRVDRAAQALAERLQQAGYTVEADRMSPEFARLHVADSDGNSTEVDLGIDWRRNEASRLSVGPVLALDDAVASKVVAVYSRAAARDFLDLDAIRATGRFSDEQLLAAAADRDPGFDRAQFARQLDLARQVTLEEVQVYGLTEADLDGVKARTAEWAQQLRDPAAAGGLDPELERGRAWAALSFPVPASEAVRRSETDGLERPEPRSGPYRGRGPEGLSR